MSLKELAASLALTTGAASPMVEVLVRREFLERQTDQDDRRGFRTVYTGPAHPYGEGLWPIPALGIGYTETKIIECYDFFRALKDNTRAVPDFRDGYAVELISEAVLESAKTNGWVEVGKI